MPEIRPISQIVHSSREPVFLTKNGYGDMVVMSIEDYEDQKFRAEINAKLVEAEIEASTTTNRYSRYEAMNLLKARLNAQKV